MLTLRPILLPRYQFFCIYSITLRFFNPCGCLRRWFRNYFFFILLFLSKMLLFVGLFLGLLRFLGWGRYGLQRFLQLILKNVIRNKLFEGDRKIYEGGIIRLFLLLVLRLRRVTFIEVAPFTIILKPSMFWLLFIRISLCTSFVLSRFFNSPRFFVCRYVVPGQRLIGYFFLVPIEVFRSMLRPLTVALRMALNMTAGIILIKFCWCGGVAMVDSFYEMLDKFDVGEIFIVNLLKIFVHLRFVVIVMFVFCFVAMFEFGAIVLHVFIYCIIIRVYELGHGNNINI